MEISKKDVEHIARLARVTLSEEEKEKYQKDLSGILDFISVLNTVDIQDISQVSSNDIGNSIEDVTRIDDEVAPLGNPEKIVEQAPKKENGFIEVKAVF